MCGHLWARVLHDVHLSFLLIQHMAPLCGLFWTLFFCLFLKAEVVSATQVLSGMETMLGRTKRASRCAALDRFYLSGKDAESEREKETARHKMETYITCTGSKPTENVRA